jgi:hypothetical protein
MNTHTQQHNIKNFVIRAYTVTYIGALFVAMGNNIKPTTVIMFGLN